jgi:peptidoglycan/LPS O-acetylase OafA/YrhL
MKKFFKNKSRMICFAWSLIGMILLVCAYFFKNSSLQEFVGNIILCYVFGSCILSGVVANISKKKTMKEFN